MNEQKTVIVLGMHRSGTSVVAGILQILGVPMGEDAWGSNYSNPFGHFEDKEFIDLNDRILKMAGGDWSHPPKREDIIRAGEMFRDEVKYIIEKRNGLNMWGWKDPRTILTLEIFIHHILNPRFVITYRNNLEIAQSLKERDGFSIEESLHLIQLYNIALDGILRHYQGEEAHLLAYENILANPQLESEKIAQFVGLEMSNVQSKRISDFIVSDRVIEKERGRYNAQAILERNAIREQLQCTLEELRAMKKMLGRVDTNNKHDDLMAEEEQGLLYMRQKVYAESPCIMREQNNIIAEQAVIIERLCIIYDEISRQISYLENSFSWHVTQPLRYIKRFIDKIVSRVKNLKV